MAKLQLVTIPTGPQLTTGVHQDEGVLLTVVGGDQYAFLQQSPNPGGGIRGVCWLIGGTLPGPDQQAILHLYDLNTSEPSGELELL